MTGRVNGKVAFITGAARGQGRSHALTLAKEGADIIAVDICDDLPSVRPFYPGATEADLSETVRLVQALGRRIVAKKADVRDADQLKAVLDAGVKEFGQLNVVVANAGIFTFGHETHMVEETAWQELLDVNLTGVWHTIKVATPHLLAAGEGGSVIIISSLAGLKGLPNTAAYTTTKHGIVGLMKVLVNELGPYRIRVNCIHPNAIDTPMIKNKATYQLFRPDLEEPSAEDSTAAFASLNPMGEPFIDAIHVSNSVLFLASDDSYFVSGAQLPVDGGAATK